MFKRTKVCTGVLVALGGSLMLAGLPALAQTAERVEITGSRIKTFEVESASPVVSLSAEAIKVEGVRSVEALLNNLPQVFADYGGSVSNGASGTATVNLRNMGSSRTLVLINGRRVPAGSPRLSAADLNQIPLSLVKRVEVLTGGASAVYGSDAVAGVVNFVMNDRFEGVQVELNHSFYNHHQQNPSNINAAVAARGFQTPGDKSSDGKVNDVSVTLGGNFAGGKGNATAFVGYKKEDALLQSERDFSACAVSPANGDPEAGTVNRFTCGGSSTSATGRFFTNIGDGDFTVADAAGNARAWNGATDLYNFGPLNYFQRPSERYTAATFVRYDISEKARAYLEASFHDDHTVAQIAPSGAFGFDASGANSIHFENPLLSRSWKDALFGVESGAPGDTAEALILRRNVEGGGRQDDIRHTSYRLVTGVKGDVGPWTYDAFAQVGRVVYQETYKNDFSVARTALALDVVTDPESGAAVCRVKLTDPTSSCVPWNIWKLGGVTPESLAFLSTPGFQKGFTAQTVYGVNGSVDLGAYGVKLPTAQSGAGLAFGFERRKEELELATDTAFTTGDLAGQGGPTIGVGGAYSVRDIFAELRLPLMEKLPFAELLNLTASYRNSDYSTGHKTNTYGAGLEYAPVRAAKFRGSYQRSARAANIVELFSAEGIGLYNMDSDPCAGPVNAAGQTADKRTLAECALTGVTAAQFGSIPDSAAQQYNALFGGNTSLKPETADSITFGLVLTPMRDLNVSVDYFKIKLKDVISNVAPPTTLTNCLDTGNPVYCGKITRDSRGTLWATPAARIVANNLNLSKYETDGLDIGVDYRFALAGMGRVNVSLLGTALNKLVIQQVTGDEGSTYDCAGLFGNTCGTPSPKWRHKLRGTWATPWNLDVSLTWRHFGKVDQDATSSNKNLKANVVFPIQAYAKAANYLDLGVAYTFNKNLMARMSVNNLLDKDPPLSASGAPFGNGNTYPVVYDALGRRVSLNLTATF